MQSYLSSRLLPLSLLALVALWQSPLLSAAGVAVETAEECRARLAVGEVPLPLRPTLNEMPPEAAAQAREGGPIPLVARHHR